MPTSTLVCEGFLPQAAAVSVGLGLPTIPVATVPGHTNVQSKDELKASVLRVTLDRVIANLTQPPAVAGERGEPAPQSVVARGGYEEINQVFYENSWSDGLPIVPPTKRRIEA